MTSVRKVAKRVLPDRVVNRIRRRKATKVEKAALMRETSISSPKSEQAVEHLIGLEVMLFSTGDRTFAERLDDAVRLANRGSEAKARGTLALARWSLRQGAPEDALRHLDQIQTSDRSLQTAVDLCRVDCLCSVGDGKTALSVLSRMTGRQLADQNLVLRVGHARSLVGQLSDNGSGSMVEALNTIYHGAGFGMLRRTLVIAPVGLDNISCEAPDAEPKDALPTVTVVIKLSEGSSDMVGISSLVRQSWRNLEVLVVAGADGRDHLSRLDPTLLDDGRVIFVDAASVEDHPLIPGLTHGTGELIMTHKPDSWAHPQRVEAQASALIVNHELRGTISSHMFVADHLRPRPFGLVPKEDLVGPNPDSLMLRASGTPTDELLAEYDRSKDHLSRVAGELSTPDGIGLVNDGVPLTLSRGRVASAIPAGRAGPS